MLLPRAYPTQSTQPTLTPSPSVSPFSPNHTSYTVITIVIVVIATIVGLTLFYLLYWRKRPSHPKVQLYVSRTGAARLRAGGPDRWRIIEQVQREQEARERCETDWGVRRMEERPRDGVILPKYSRDVEAADVRRSELDVEEVQAQATISVPPPAYDQSLARPPGRTHP
jgi:hypothetical protein